MKNFLINKKYIAIVGVIFFTFFTFFPAMTFADSSYTLLAPLPTSSSNSQTSVDPTTNIGSYIQTLIKIFVSLAGVVAVFMIVYGGILYMSTDNINGKKEGRTIIIRTLSGFLLLAVAYLILSAINPNFLNLDIFSRIPNAQLASGPGTTQVGTGTGASGCQLTTPTAPGVYERVQQTTGTGFSSSNCITYPNTWLTGDMNANMTACNAQAATDAKSYTSATCEKIDAQNYSFTYTIQTYYPSGSEISPLPGDPQGQIYKSVDAESGVTFTGCGTPEENDPIIDSSIVDCNIYNKGGLGPVATMVVQAVSQNDCATKMNNISNSGSSGNSDNKSIVKITSSCNPVSS